MTAFMVLELKDGRIQGLGRRNFKEVPSRGESIKFASVEGEQALWYEVVEVDFATDPTSAGDIVLTLKI
jgi:hypothetical protein